jgi:D-alanyl-D-alanine carboxypeptidase
MLEFEKRIKAIHRKLRIPEAYESHCGLTLQKEENDLTAIGNDIYGRPQRLAVEAAKSWNAMKFQAGKDGVCLRVVSAFRDVDKQTEIIQRKIDSGRSISEILRVCAAPGYSEHHTGRAVDLTTIGCEPLSESFETTEAFEWLKENANFYSFKLSYPKGNNSGISYEPWHWAYDPK